MEAALISSELLVPYFPGGTEKNDAKSLDKQCEG
jgi:hypothetical protein